MTERISVIGPPDSCVTCTVMGRSYSEKDLKVLWGAHTRCAFPDCRKKLILNATDEDPAKPLGKICHIVAHSDDGPRGDPSFPAEKRDSPDNLILLCGTHHDEIDVQPNTYTSEEIRAWKAEHESWVEATLSDAAAALTFTELEQAVEALLATPPGTDDDLTPPTPPQRKMEHNSLTAAIAPYYRVGQLRFHDIEALIDQFTGWDINFGERLKAGFSKQYDELWDRGLRGDELYIELAQWASGGQQASFAQEAAGVSILSYLFHICDVFEPAPN